MRLAKPKPKHCRRRVCGREFLATNSNQAYCSHACADAVKRQAWNEARRRRAQPKKTYVPEDRFCECGNVKRKGAVECARCAAMPNAAEFIPFDRAEQER